MNFFRMMRYLFWLLIVSWSVAIAAKDRWQLDVARRRGAPKARRGRRRQPEARGWRRRLVRDPVCGMHVAEVLAMPLREGGETLHFCSVACRDEIRWHGTEKDFRQRHSELDAVAAADKK